MGLNGILLINKERGISSNSVVNKVKHILKADKAGHLGTLDVLGEGLLPVTLGKCTKLFDFYLNKDKVYKTIFKFGETTDTLDLEGEVTLKNDVIITKEKLNSIIPQFIGEQNQLPPQYSAKKINGQKAYDLARKGIENIELKPKLIHIYSIKILSQIDANVFELEIHCSSGTYIRSICRDMATKLSTYGVMLKIIRTRCADFDISNSYTLQDLKNGNYKIITVQELFDYPSINLDDNETNKILNGININYPKDGFYKLFNNNKFLGLVNVTDNKMRFTLRCV